MLFLTICVKGSLTPLGVTYHHLTTSTSRTFSLMSNTKLFSEFLLLSVLCDSVKQSSAGF